MTAPARRLRVVKPGEPTRRKKPLKVTTAAQDGDRRDLLVALRARIAQTVEDPNTPPRDLAALSRRLLEIARDIEAIDADDQEGEVGSAAATPDEQWTAT
jgi:hypothetical protein